MKYYIDQSGKIENTKDLTIVAYAGDKTKSLRISAVEKRKLIQVLKKLEGEKRIYIYKIFSSLVYILLLDSSIKDVVIDKEYPGQEPIIKDLIIKFFEAEGLKYPNIHFGLIGKDNPSHEVAIKTFRGKLKPDLIVGAKQVIELIYGKKIGRSSHSR